ncbi:MAG: carbohydrate kinase [Abditibacteriota bacterium]|nr:carbohydrate kinase [Abditibacteriota bacterium]
MDRKRFLELSGQFGSRTIAVIGDFFLDRYLYFDESLREESRETGLAANQVIRVVHSPGAAGNILTNLVKMGAGRVIAVGYTGDDGEGYELRQDVRQLGCSDEYMLLFDRHTCTYTKPQNAALPGLSGEKERYDIKNRTPFTPAEEERLTDKIAAAVEEADGVVIADQSEVEEEGCGLITPRVREALHDLTVKYPAKVFWVDSRLRGHLFANMIVKPNAAEAVGCMMKDAPLTEDNLLLAGKALAERTGKPVFLTRSEQGVSIFDSRGVTLVPARQVEGEIDPTGAGDSFTAGAVLTLAAGGTCREAAETGCLTASVSVKMLGRTGYATCGDILGLLSR